MALIGPPSLPFSLFSAGRGGQDKEIKSSRERGQKSRAKGQKGKSAKGEGGGGRKDNKIKSED